MLSMKKLFIFILISCFFFACKTTKVTTTGNAATTKATADSALGGDKLKDATKP